MMKPAVLIRFIVSFVLLMFAYPGIAGDWGEFAVSPSADDQERPDVHGERIVWQQLIEYEGLRDWDIYLTDLGAELITATDVTPYGYDQERPAIYGNNVVWEDNAEGEDDWDVFLTDITDPDNPILHYVGYLPGNQRNPAISGNIALWQDDSVGAFDIMGADVTALISEASQEIPEAAYFWITTFETSRQEKPAIYRNTVVWQDDGYRNDNWNIISADIWQQNDPIENVVSYTESDKEVPTVWGDIVVWQKNVGGDWDIWAADISNPELPVKFPISQAASLQSNPDVGDNLVVWQDYRNGKDWDIYGYNLTTRQEFQITDDDTDQINPAVSGNLVVWQDYRGGHPNIFAVELTGPEVARCDVRPAGDTNGDCQVNLRDLATIGQTWLNCGLDDQTACSY